MHSIVSTSTILVNDFKNLLRHTRHERLHDVIGNVSPGGEQTSLAIHPQRFSIGFESGEHVRWMIQKTNAISLGISFWLTSSVNRSIILLKNLIFSTQTSPFSEERSNMSMYPVALWRPCTTCSSMHSSSVRECTPYHDWASSTVSRWESLRWDILAMPITLKTIENKTLLRRSTSHV